MSESIYGDGHLAKRDESFFQQLTEQQLLEQRLREQQRQSEEDSKWLMEKESNLVSESNLNKSIIVIEFYFIYLFISFFFFL